MHRLLCLLVLPALFCHAAFAADLKAAKHGPKIEAISKRPELRIRLAASHNQLTLGQKGQSLHGRIPGQSDKISLTAPVLIRWDAARQGLLLTDGANGQYAWRTGRLNLESSNNLTFDGKTFPGFLEVVAVQEEGQPVRLDLLNHVLIENYLPGVLAKEMFPKWEPAAYRAQAIAARSYALWEAHLSRLQGKHFDLEATVSSQAYLGAEAHPKAKKAVADTAGQVLTWEGRVLPAFFSASAGKRGQDAIAAFPDRVANLTPLRGREHGRIETKSPRYQWGPAKRDAATLTRRIAAWGKQNDHPIAHLKQLACIHTQDRSSQGRPATFRVTDENGTHYEMTCEDLRFACNTPTGDLPKPEHLQMIWSSDFQAVRKGDQFHFTGHGYGHGVGMSQWGAQLMAEEGHSHRHILAWYYPGTQIQALPR